MNISLLFLYTIMWYAYSHGTFIASSKASSPDSAIWCFLFQIPVSSYPAAAYVFSLVFPSLPYIFPPTTCLRRQFLRKMCPIHLAFLHFIVCKIFLCSLNLFNTKLKYKKPTRCHLLF